MNTYLISSKEKELVGVLSEKNHIVKLTNSDNSGYPLYSLYKESGVYENPVLESLLLGGGSLNSPFGVEHTITNWVDPSLKTDPEGNPLDLIVYAEDITNKDTVYYWEPVVENRLRKQFFDQLSDRVKKIENKVPEITMGYIAGTKHPMGNFRDKGLLSSSNRIGYILWLIAN